MNVDNHTMWFVYVGEIANIEEAIKQVNAEIQAENSNLHVLNTSLHEKNHSIALKVNTDSPSLRSDPIQ